jgi:hypothetical protein
MKRYFSFSKFPGSKFEIELSYFSLKFKIMKDGNTLDQSKDKNKAYLIANNHIEIIKVLKSFYFNTLLSDKKSSLK